MLFLYFFFVNFVSYSTFLYFIQFIDCYFYLCSVSSPSQLRTCQVWMYKVQGSKPSDFLWLVFSSSFDCSEFFFRLLPASGFRLLASGKMSSRVFSIIGDRNVLDNMTSYNTASREVMQSAQIINCPALSELAKAFLEIRLVSFRSNLMFIWNHVRW